MELSYLLNIKINAQMLLCVISWLKMKITTVLKVYVLILQIINFNIMDQINVLNPVVLKVIH